jgi:sigma-B regulation protein RsbU (phosphoserine phosphatase)
LETFGRGTLGPKLALAARVLTQTLEAVNRQVHASALADRYATLFYGVFDGSKRTLRYVNAGHHPPMVIRQDGSVEWLEAGGAPVGMFAESNYGEAIVRLNPGDLLLAYTDGIVEMVNPEGEEWGIEGLQRAAARNKAQCADDIVNAVFTSLDEFSCGSQNDDATLLVLRVQ